MTLLSEIFNSPSKYKSSKGGNIDTHTFTTKSGIHFNVNVFKVDNFRHAGVDIPKSGIGFDFQNLDATGDKEGITNTGDELEVFSTVLKIIEEAVAAYDPELVAFGAHESNRQKLYDRMIKLMQRKYDYKLLDKAPVMFPLGKSKYYVLEKQ